MTGTTSAAPRPSRPRLDAAAFRRMVDAQTGETVAMPVDALRAIADALDEADLFHRTLVNFHSAAGAALRKAA